MGDPLAGDVQAVDVGRQQPYRLNAEECLERIRGVISRVPKEAWEHTDKAWHTDIWWALHTVDALTYEAPPADGAAPVERPDPTRAVDTHGRPVGPNWSTPARATEEDR